MSFTGWVLLATSTAGLYALGLIGYRLLLSARTLNKEADQARRLMAEVQEFDELPLSRAKPSTGSDLGKLLLERHRLNASKDKRAEERRRRLIQGIREIEIDKR